MTICPICKHASKTMASALEHVDSEHPTISFRTIVEWLDNIGALSPEEKHERSN
jgi:hypothetical protein